MDKAHLMYVVILGGFAIFGSAAGLIAARIERKKAEGDNTGGPRQVLTFGSWEAGPKEETRAAPRYVGTGEASTTRPIPTRAPPN